jgi:hypothetical protein
MVMSMADVMAEMANMTACDVSGSDSVCDVMHAHASRVRSAERPDPSQMSATEPTKMSAAEPAKMSAAEPADVSTAEPAHMSAAEASDVPPAHMAPTMAPTAARLRVGGKQAARSRGGGQNDHHPA